MIIRLGIVALLSALVALPAGPAFAGPFTVTQSGPNSAFAADRISMNLTDKVLVGADITTGKSNSVLVIQVTLQDDDAAGGGQIYSFRPLVNGQGQGLVFPPTHGTNAHVVLPTGAPGFASTTVTWWLDLDDNGMANQPLSIDVWGQANFGSSTTNISMVAYTLQK